MDLETFHWLLTEAGQALVAAAMAGDADPAGELRELERLRAMASAERAAAAYETAVLRRRAATRFALADRLYFTREALEQASGEAIAVHRAERYRGYGAVADLACGIGGDALALAGVASVVAVDRDPLRLAMAAANALAVGLADRIRFITADLEREPPPAADAIFFDPARRREGRRTRRAADYTPPLALVDAWRRATPAIGVKAGPALPGEDLAALDDGSLEVEFISVAGELKEAALWYGPLASPGRRATLLSAPLRPARIDTLHCPGEPPWPPVAEPMAYLYEPDPAVIRAGLVGVLAERIGASAIDRDIAYLTADRPVRTPFARCWRVLEWQPFAEKKLRARLRALEAGHVTVKKRGSPVDTDALARRLSGFGGPRGRPLVVVLTRAGGRVVSLICEGPLSG